MEEDGREAAPSEPWFWGMLGSALLHQSIFFVMALAAAGCSSAPAREFHLYRSDMNKNAFGERELAVMHFGDEEDIDAPRLRVNKVTRGYSLHANLDEDEGRRKDIVFKRDRESKWFLGYQWKLEF